MKLNTLNFIIAIIVWYFDFPTKKCKSFKYTDIKKKETKHITDVNLNNDETRLQK